MPLKIIHNDITEMETEAIVNAANVYLHAGGGVCGAIFNKAGFYEMSQACQKLPPIAVGEATITPGFHLKAKYVIHAVGPVYKDGKHNEKNDLANAYKNSLKIAIENNIESISFPLLSSGIYGYPKKEALDVAIEAITQFLNDYDLDVNIVVFDRKAVQLSEELYHEIEHFINTYYVENIYRHETKFTQQNLYTSKPIIKKYFFEDDDERSLYDSLDELIEDQHETFSAMLIHLIDEKGYTDVEVYKRANIDRKLFSKIRSQKDYHPKKNTVFSFAVALKLNIDETKGAIRKCWIFAI